MTHAEMIKMTLEVSEKNWIQLYQDIIYTTLDDDLPDMLDQFFTDFEDEVRLVIPGVNFMLNRDPGFQECVEKFFKNI